MALFGQPGTGKTFATKGMILGSENQGVPAYGLPGLNRYCGGMIPAKFIAIGEAYQGRKFNFIVTELNGWFKYKGMASNLILEHLETKTVPFSMRLESRAVQLASVLSLTNYFNISSDMIPIDSTAARMAIQFFVEEAWIRRTKYFHYMKY